MNHSKNSKRRISSKVQAGQYMCAECAKVFDTKLEVDKHRRKKHETEFN
jgi:hypothetical protein